MKNGPSNISFIDLSEKNYHIPLNSTIHQPLQHNVFETETFIILLKLLNNLVFIPTQYS